MIGTVGNASGTGVLLSVGIMISIVRGDRREQMMEMHPVLRQFFGATDNVQHPAGMGQVDGDSDPGWVNPKVVHCLCVRCTHTVYFRHPRLSASLREEPPGGPPGGEGFRSRDEGAQGDDDIAEWGEDMEDHGDEYEADTSRR